MKRLLLRATATLALVAMVQTAVARPRGMDIDPERFDWQKEIFVPMRDGVNLSTDVILPKGAKKPLGTILVRTPYDKEQLEWNAGYQEFLDAGYAVVIQNERGRYFSEGVFTTYMAGAGTDGYDAVQWVAKQPWSNGKVGTIGCSSSGEQQWPMANSKPPALAAMIPGASGTAIGSVPGNDTQGAIYRGGIPQSGLWAWWYHDMATTERLVLPPNTTQEQRVRLRNSFSLMPKTWFYKIEPGAIDLTNEKNDIKAHLMQLPSKDASRRLGGALTPFDEFMTWMPGGARWNNVPLASKGFSSTTPALHINTWHDVGVGETTRMFKYLQDGKTPNQYLIIGSGPHCAFMGGKANAALKFGDLDLGDVRYKGVDDGYQKLFHGWFDHLVRGEKSKVMAMPKVQLHVMHKGWISGNQWPLEGTSFTRYYLDSAPAAGLKPDGKLGTAIAIGSKLDSYVYDPAVPVPTRGGGCCGTDMALDQRQIEARADVLSYTSPVLDKGVTVAGPIEVVLYVSSSAKDTDFTVKLIDVFPDGKAINLSDDGFRVRYREGFDKKVLMKEGEVYEIKLTNMVTANYFQPGHRIRLDVSSSNFPAFERNLNTGGNNYDETSWVTAVNAIHHSKDHPSHVVLPIIQ